MAQGVSWTSLELRNPGRQSLLSTLRGFWSTSPPAFVYIYDPLTKLNTSNLVSDLLSLLEETGSDRTNSLDLGPGLLRAQIDGTECVSPKVLFDRVLNGLANWIPKWEDGCLNWASTKGENFSDNFDAFVHGLRTLYDEKGKSSDPFGLSQSNQGKNVVIAVTYAERLKESIPNLVAPLARLADIVRQ
jgi:origin recognition complex subunit 5